MAQPKIVTTANSASDLPERSQQGKPKLTDWVEAARPRTLPLALSSIAMGSLLAGTFHTFKWPVFFFSVLTTVFLQILSNLANDYGDSVNGADHKGRSGPGRAVQTGKISLSSMLNAVIIFSGLSLLSGITLLFLAFRTNFLPALLFLVLGLACIAAAITYTAGKKPYGYAGLGDISVFLFFGLTGVCGTFYLQAHTLPAVILLPAAACGFLSVGVLNINNIRDIESDRTAGKKSIPVRLGGLAARRYHLLLLTGSVAATLGFVLSEFRHWQQLIFLGITPLLVLNGLLVWKRQDPKGLDPLLKQLALSTLLFVLVFGFGQLLSSDFPLIKVGGLQGRSPSSLPSPQTPAPAPNRL